MKIDCNDVFNVSNVEEVGKYVGCNGVVMWFFFGLLVVGEVWKDSWGEERLVLYFVGVVESVRGCS